MFLLSDYQCQMLPNHEQIYVHDLNNTIKLNLVGGTHFGTERPALLEVLDLFREYAILCEYSEDEELLRAT